MTEQKLIDKAKRLGVDVRDTEQLVQRLEGARNQLSSALDELRMLTTVTRERIVWLIGKMDELEAELRKT